MMSELLELDEGSISNLQTLGQVNQERNEKRNSQLKVLLQQKREELKIRKAELEKEYESNERKISFKTS